MVTDEAQLIKKGGAELAHDIKRAQRWAVRRGDHRLRTAQCPNPIFHLHSSLGVWNAPDVVTRRIKGEIIGPRHGFKCATSTPPNPLH